MRYVLVEIIDSYIFAVAAALDINIIYATLMKNLRNRIKYNPAEMNKMFAAGYDYSFIMNKMVAEWENGRSGDQKFFEEFLAEFPLELSWVVTQSHSN